MTDSSRLKARYQAGIFVAMPIESLTALRTVTCSTISCLHPHTCPVVSCVYTLTLASYCRLSTPSHLPPTVACLHPHTCPVLSPTVACLHPHTCPLLSLVYTLTLASYCRLSTPSHLPPTVSYSLLSTTSSSSSHVLYCATWATTGRTIAC
jgi:hypothetical protein